MHIVMKEASTLCGTIICPSDVRFRSSQTSNGLLVTAGNLIKAHNPEIKDCKERKKAGSMVIYPVRV